LVSRLPVSAIYTHTRSSAVAEKPRDAARYLEISLKAAKRKATRSYPTVTLQMYTIMTLYTSY